MSGFFPLLWWTLGGAMALGACIYLVMEYQAYLLRTKVVNVPGGLRFVAQSFAVEVRHSAKEVMVVAKDARYLRKALPSGDEQEETGALTVTLAAAGLRMEVARISVKEGEDGNAMASGLSRIVFTASDELLRQTQGKTASEHSELRLPKVPDAIASDFQQFANGVRAWVDKTEAKLEAEVAANRKREEEAAAEKIAAQLTDDTSIPLSEEERAARAEAQLEKWRAQAGFKGTSTGKSVDARGRIVWLIDMDATGRVILHAGDRTFRGSLKGATITGLGGEVELAVRDEYWLEDDPHLATFRILGGSAPDIRRAWKERLDLLVQSLDGGTDQRR